MAKNKSIPKRVTAKYLQLVLPIILVLFSALAYVIYCLDSHNQIRMNQEFGQKMLDQANKTLKTWIDDQIVVLSMIATDSRVVEACADPTDLEKVAKANAFLRSFHEKNDFYENIALSAELSSDKSFEIKAVDGNRHLIKRGVFFADSSRGASIGKSNVEHPMAKSIYTEGRPHVVTHVYRSLIYGNPAFIISLPVYKDGRFVGAAHVAMPMKGFTDKFVNEVKLGETGYMFMVDDKGLLISHVNKELILSEDAAKRYDSIISRILNGEERFEQEKDGQRKTYNSLRFDFNGLNHVSDWYLVFVQNSDEILASSVRFIWLISAFLVMAFLLVTTVIYISTVRLLNIGFRDSLTGLYNRNYFEQEIKRISTGCSNSIGFISIDVDGLKVVNDNLGHSAGDRLLTTVGKLIKKSFGTKHSVIRFGGDEFIVLLVNEDEEFVEKACQTLKEEIEAYNAKKLAAPISVSLGWAVGKLENSNDIHKFIEVADERMYCEKELNRLRYMTLFEVWRKKYLQ